MRRITMKHIAEIAGVSATTVSRAFHSPHTVRPETYNRILRICKKNRYVYNATAGDLSSKKSTVIGLIIPTARNSIFGKTIMVIQERAQEVGYSIMLGITNYNKMIEQRILQQFLERQVAGLILTGFCIGQEGYIKELVETGVPCVVRSEKLDDNAISYVGFDNFKAAYSMTEYLISLNHRRIGLIIGPFSKVGRVMSRLEGYRSALEKHSIPYDPSLVIEREPALTEGKEAMGLLMTLDDPPTALFAASDWLAIGAMDAVKQMGLCVPKDISVAGFDDIDVAAYIDPPLTTVRTPTHEIAEKSIEVLMEMIQNGTNGVRQYCLDTDLIIRKSCAVLTHDT